MFVVLELPCDHSNMLIMICHYTYLVGGKYIKSDCVSDAAWHVLVGSLHGVKYFDEIDYYCVERLSFESGDLSMFREA